MSEIWKKTNIEGYEVSTLGRVRSYKPSNGSGPLRTEPKILKPILLTNGYHAINVGKLRKLCRLVCETFNGNSELQVNHINGIKTDDRLENLEFCTASQNVQHAYDTGLMAKGINHHKATLTDAQVKEILEDKRSHRKIAADYNVSQVHISRLKRNGGRK